MLEENFIFKEIEFSRLEILYDDQLKFQQSKLMCYSKSGISIKSEEINSFIVKLKELENRFYDFESIARMLNNEGKPKLLKNLTRILNDIQYQIQKYDNQYQSKLKEEQISHVLPVRNEVQVLPVRNIAGNSSKNPWTEAMIEVSKNQQKSNERLHKLFEANLTGNCPNCKRSLGEYYYILDICPYCKLALKM